MKYPITMQVHVIWHPEGDELCRPLAERIYLTLNRDPHQPMLPGIGIPVFFRNAGADVANPNGVPRPIDIPDTNLDLRIALVTEDLVADPDWMSYLENSGNEIDRKPGQAMLLSVDLSGGGLEGERLAVRLDPKEPGLEEQLVQHVLLQCCRLLARRPLAETDGPSGAAPLMLFLSHTKRDNDGLEIATAIKGYLDNLAVDRFFDEVSIQPGDKLSPVLDAAIRQSALVCIRTDSYVSSPWCRRELSLAKRHRRPMVVIDALSRREPRASSLLAHLPSVRMSVGTLERGQMQAAVNFIVLEIVRFLYASEQLMLLQKNGLLPPDVILMTRPPEARDLALILSADPPGSTPPVFLYPDPMMPAEESDDIEALGTRTVTPTSFWRERLTGLDVALSLSPGEPDELRVLGLSLHVEDAMRVIARQLLAAGATLHYGGMLFPGALTETLFEMIGTYNKDDLKLPPLVNHMAWPLYKEIDNKWLAPRRRMLAIRPYPAPPDVRTLGLDGMEGPGYATRLRATPEGRYALGRSLSEMRAQNARATRARIILGGKLHSFMGFYPGILEETLFGIETEQALYVLGGFGGATRALAQALVGRVPQEFTRSWQEKKSSEYRTTLAFYDSKRADDPDSGLPAIDYEEAVERLRRLGVSGIAGRNGLDEDENLFLLETASVDAALYLIMKGITKITRQSPGGVNHPH